MGYTSRNLLVGGRRRGDLLTCGCAGAVVSSRLTPPPNNFEWYLTSTFTAANLYSMCASLAAIDQPSKARYTAQNASASNTGRRGASSSSAALSARPRRADTPARNQVISDIYYNQPSNLYVSRLSSKKVENKQTRVTKRKSFVPSFVFSFKTSCLHSAHFQWKLFINLISFFVLAACKGCLFF